MILAPDIFGDECGRIVVLYFMIPIGNCNVRHQNPLALETLIKYLLM
jgi:hypothetical protein